MVVKYETVSIKWYGHSSFLVKGESGVKVAFDPFQVAEGEIVDLLIVTHEHHDHCHPESIKKFVGPKTQVVTIQDAANKMDGLDRSQVHIVSPGEKLELAGIALECVPAYNTSKHYHPKNSKKIGVIAAIDGVKVYHAGDTDCIEEMKDFDVDVALLPVSGTYVMDVSEALQAVKHIKPKLAIPMHYGSIVGDVSMAKEFISSCSCPCELPSA